MRLETGARIALLNKAARDEIEAVVRRIEKIETAVEPKFQQHFVEAMAIPHKTAPYPNLSKVVTFPQSRKSRRWMTAAGREGSGGGGSRQDLQCTQMMSSKNE